MKPILKFTAFFLSILLIVSSCKKETLGIQNKTPVANAGLSQTIFLPGDSLQLDGSASNDPDGVITTYLWTKIGGPLQSTISTPNLSKTSVKSLALGLYLFELTVTDNEGSSSKDTVQIAVNGTFAFSCAARQYDLDISSAGNYIAGNFIDPWGYSLDEKYNLTAISGKAVLPSGEVIQISIHEYAGTADVDTLFTSSFSIAKGSYGNSLDLNGVCSVNVKQLLNSGGGIFSGTLTVTGGSAWTCYAYGLGTSYTTLTLSGNIDMSSHVDLNIKGKAYF